MKKAAILGGVRIPFSRSMSKYMGVDNKTLMTTCLNGLVEKYSLQGQRLGEVALGAVMKHSRDWNMARECVLGTSLSRETPAYDLQQACGTSLEAALLVANKIKLGQIDAGIAGGTDTNSDLPIVFGQKFTRQLLESYRGRTTWDRIKPLLKITPMDFKPIVPGVVEPRTGLSMGQSCELMAQKWQISREDQDQLAFESHQKASNAYEEGFYDDLLLPFRGLEKDNNVRGDTSLEKLRKLRPVFEKSSKGTLTAGNSTPLTDGASCALLASDEWAEAHQLEVLAHFVDGETAAVDFINKDGLLMAPVYAVPRLLKRNNLRLQDFDFYEIHEAFAAQALCTFKAWESEEFCKNQLGLSQALGAIDRKKLNVKGGSLALGHPFAATGTRILASLAKILKEKGEGRGLISVCTAGGMGVTAIIERKKS